MAWLYQAQTSTKALQLGNEEYGHRLAIGTNWTRLRIGCHIAVPGLQSFDGNLPFCFMLGLCRGTTAMFKSPNCEEFLGLTLGNSSISSFTYGTSPGPHFFNGRPSVVSKVGSVITLHTGLSANYYFSALASVRTVAFIDITKNGSAGTITFTAWMPGTTTQATTDNTYSVFMQSMENNTTPTNANSVVGNTTVTHPGDGLFDTIYIGWNKSYPALNVYELCACRVL